MQQKLATKTAELAEQKARGDNWNLQRTRLVMKHLQGDPLLEKTMAWGQSWRQKGQRAIEGLLAKQLRLPIQQVTDIAPAFLKHSYVLEVISPENFTLTHEKYAMRFSSDELRPNGRDCMEQFRGAVGKKQRRDQAGPTLSDAGLEM